jgi:hypothetical protein
MCGVCLQGGKMICCDDCPVSFHSECLGYQSKNQGPRGKWKCYFCKVAKHGANLTQRKAPGEIAYCFDLLDPKVTWQEKAIQFLEVIQNYFCMNVFFGDGLESDVIDFMIARNIMSKDIMNFNPASAEKAKEKIDQEGSEKITPVSVDNPLPSFSVLLEKLQAQEVPT